MSWQTQNWAGEQRRISPQAKLILIGMASCADANHCAYPSVGWLIEWSGLERKTVLKWLAEMADDKDGAIQPLIVDTGDRKGKSLQIKVWRLNVGAAGDVDALETPKETVPKTGQSQKREHPKKSPRQSQKRDTEPFREPITPSSPNGDDPPSPDLNDDRDGEGLPAGIELPPPPVTVRPHSLPDQWEPPAVADLGDVSRPLVQQWPAGAYQAVAEQFRSHWAAATGRTAKKSNWGAAWVKWVITEHDKIMRAAKAGTSFAVLAPAKSHAVWKPATPVVAQAGEDKQSAGFRVALEQEVGARTYGHWLKPAAILFDAGGVTVVVSTDFQQSYVEANLQMAITVALARWAEPGGPMGVRIVSEASQNKERVASHG